MASGQMESVHRLAHHTACSSDDVADAIEASRQPETDAFYKEHRAEMDEGAVMFGTDARPADRKRLKLSEIQMKKRQGLS